MPLPVTWPRRAEVFAVGTDDAQVVWRDLGAGPVQIHRDGTVVATGDDARLGGVTFGGLEPGTTTEVTLVPGDGRRRRLRVTTLVPPPGPRVGRLATISDLHLGARSFGFTGTVRERPEPPVPHPLRCARAAAQAASDWGAETLLLKGDLTHNGEPDEWAQLEAFLDELSVPHPLVIGNHDVKDGDRARAEVALAAMGRPARRVQVLDRDPVRIILADFSVAGRHNGRPGDDGTAVLDAAADAGGPVIVVLHFHLHRTVLPWFIPRGIPYLDARRFLDQLDRVAPGALVTCGHSHRNRRYRHRSLTVCEVGAPKDYPGVWAGYDVHEGGVVQTTRRITRPDCMAWTERTRRVAAGTWGLWSPGTLDQRSFRVVH